MNGRDFAVRYLPPGQVDEVRRWAPKEVSDSEVWRLMRLMERVYAEGYDAGHRRGYDEGIDHKARPDQNDINALRERMAEEAKEENA